MHGSVTVSRFQKEVTKFMRDHVDKDLKVEQSVMHGMPPVDVVLSGSKTIVQIDGPSHYLFGFDVTQTPVPTPKMMMYDNLYKAKGWKVVHISFKEWQELSEKTAKFTAKQQVAAKLDLLTQLGLPQSIPEGIVGTKPGATI
jgi:very-short-patch-repair endonuclease